jgi:hypothetical protein
MLFEQAMEQFQLWNERRAPRDVMEKADSYHQALSTLTTSKLLAPVYFILAGNATDQVKFK